MDFMNLIKDMAGKFRGTMFEAPEFNAQTDAESIHAAIKDGNEDAVVDTLPNRSVAQRQEIKQQYKTTFGRDLEEHITSDMCQKTAMALVWLLCLPAQREARQLYAAMQGGGTDEKCLIEILSSRSNQEIKNICEAYTQEYGSSLEEDVTSETAGHFQRVLTSLLTGNRDESTQVNDALAQEDAQALYDAGEASWGTDETCFLRILCVRSHPHLRSVFTRYNEIAGKDIIVSIKSEMSGHLEDVLLAVVKCIIDLPGYFAERLYKSMKGMGTDDQTLARIMVARAEVDMLDVRKEFKAKYEESLHSFIEGDSSGSFARLLLRLCGGED
uniref:annexin A4-like isoform X1 n=1 Tax=Myxine glutinosa TaxID=7769 RepID=UPI00358EAEE8